MKESCLYKMTQFDGLADALEAHQVTRLNFIMDNYVRKFPTSLVWSESETLTIKGRPESTWKDVEFKFHTITYRPEMASVTIYNTGKFVEHSVMTVVEAASHIIDYVEKGRLVFEVKTALAMMP